MICRWLCKLNPEPWTSPTASLGRKGKKVIPLLHKNPKLRTFQLATQEEFQAAAPDWIPVDRPIMLRFAFKRSTTGGQPCDLSNLVKATEDALQQYLFTNDRNVLASQALKLEQGPGVDSLLAVELRTVADAADAEEMFVTCRGFSRWISLHETQDNIFEHIRTTDDG